MTLKPLIFLFICFLFSGCWFSNRSVPFPVGESEFARPVTKPLKFSPARKAKWTTIRLDSVHPRQVSHFDMDKLPSKNFNPNGFTALKSPPEQNAFHYSELPDTSFNLDQIPSTPLVMKTVLLGQVKNQH